MIRDARGEQEMTSVNQVGRFITTQTAKMFVTNGNHLYGYASGEIEM